MNLTQTKRWKEFEDWYIENDYHDFIELHSDESWMDRLPSFVGLKFEFQEGVYRKFVKEKSVKFELKESRYPYHITVSSGFKSFRTFKEGVKWFFEH